MYTHLFIAMLSTSTCFCYAGYELFQGFVTDVDDISDTTTEETFLYSFFRGESETPRKRAIRSMYKMGCRESLRDKFKENASILRRLQHPNSTNETRIPLTSKSKVNLNKVTVETTSIRPSKFKCPEDEKPSNIGPYEIPTQRDLVLFTRNILLDMFNSYNKEAFYLLKDIKAATKATSEVEKKCEGNKLAYRKCVKQVSRQCEQITKNLVKSLGNQKHEISNLTKAEICNLAEMRTNPIEVLKSLAQEKVYLEFALPGFLRLLSACSLNCIRSTSVSSYYEIKPMRHMTDQDLVIKHFLTRKNYLQLIMDSRHKSMANSN